MKQLQHMVAFTLITTFLNNVFFHALQKVLKIAAKISLLNTLNLGLALFDFHVKTKQLNKLYRILKGLLITCILIYYNKNRKRFIGLCKNCKNNNPYFGRKKCYLLGMCLSLMF